MNNIKFFLLIMHHPMRLVEVLLYKSGILKKPREVTISTFFGRNMEIILPEIVSSVLYLTGRFEQDVEEMLEKLVKKGDVLVDIGAHFGYFSLLASSLVGKNGKVYSFEPAPSTFQLLKKNCDPYNNITSINKAVFSKKTKLFLQDFGLVYSALNSFFSPRIDKNLVSLKIEVDAVTLDDYFLKLPKPNFIKIDAENAEYEIMKGMKNLLGIEKPIICMEFGGDFVETKKMNKKLLDLLIKNEYEIFFYEKGRIKRYINLKKNSYINLLCIAKGNDIIQRI